MPASPQSSPAPFFLRGLAALLVALLALGGALLGALLLAAGALLTFGLRALGIGGRRPRSTQQDTQPAPPQRVIEGEYRVVDPEPRAP